MADVQVNVKVDAKEADESIKGLTRQLKALREQQAKLPEGSAAWKKLGQDINELEGRLGDLNDRFNTLRGSGVERLQSSFGLLREGLTSADFGKAKIALQGIGQAMAAIPILLIVSGIMKLIENFDKLKSSGGLLGQALTAIGDVLDFVGDKFTDFLDLIQVIDKDLQKISEQIDKNASFLGGFLDEQIRQRENQIRILQAQGKDTVKLEKEKQAVIIATNKLIIQQIEASIAAGNKLTEDQQKRLADARKAIQQAQVEGQILEAKAEQERAKKNAAAAEAAKRAKDEELKRRLDLEKQISDANIAGAENQQKLNKMIADDEARARQEKIDAEQAAADAEYNILVEKAKKEKELADAEALKKQQIRDAEFALATASLNSLQSLSDTFFAIRLANLEEGSKKEQEVARRQFNLNKALAISSTLISGFQGVVNALSAKSTIPEPFGQALKVANAVSIGLATAANVAKISAQQFKSTASGSTASGGGTPRNNNTPNVNTPTPPQAQLPNQQGTFIQDQRVYVLESDISKAQSRVTRVEEQAKF